MAGMNRERTKRGWKFWTAIGLGGLVVYILSIGPASLFAREKQLRVIYAPVYLVADISPKPVLEAFRSYLTLFSGSPEVIHRPPRSP